MPTTETTTVPSAGSVLVVIDVSVVEEPLEPEGTAISVVVEEAVEPVAVSVEEETDVSAVVEVPVEEETGAPLGGRGFAG